jgi:hypothetical protein
VLGLKARTERLLRGKSAPSWSELEQLLTESCAQSYTVEAQRLHAKRRMVAALADASGSATQYELWGVSLWICQGVITRR